MQKPLKALHGCHFFLSSTNRRLLSIFRSCFYLLASSMIFFVSLRLRQIKNDKFVLRIRVHLPELRLPAAIDKSTRIKIRHMDPEVLHSEQTVVLSNAT